MRRNFLIALLVAFVLSVITPSLEAAAPAAAASRVVGRTPLRSAFAIAPAKKVKHGKKKKKKKKKHHRRRGKK